MEKGKRKWVRIINIYMYIRAYLYSACYVYVCTKGGETNKFKGGSPTCIKNTGDKIGIPDD